MHTHVVGDKTGWLRSHAGRCRWGFRVPFRSRAGPSPSPGPGHPGLGFSGAAASCSAPGNPGIAKARSGSDGRRSGSRVSSAELPVAARATRRAAQTTTSTWPGPLTRNNASTAAGFTDGDPNIRPSPEVPDGLENRAPERQKRNGTMAHVSRA